MISHLGFGEDCVNPTLIDTMSSDHLPISHLLLLTTNNHTQPWHGNLFDHCEGLRTPKNMIFTSAIVQRFIPGFFFQLDYCFSLLRSMIIFHSPNDNQIINCSSPHSHAPWTTTIGRLSFQHHKDFSPQSTHLHTMVSIIYKLFNVSHHVALIQAIALMISGIQNDLFLENMVTQNIWNTSSSLT